MVQCTNCKCQVGSGIAICPYCGTRLPLEDQPSERQNVTYIRPGQQGGGATPTGAFYREPVPAAIQMQSIPMYRQTEAYYGYTERQPWSRTTEIVLLVLLVGMIIANIFEFVALMLLFLR